MRRLLLGLAMAAAVLCAHEAHGKKSTAPASAKALKSPLTAEQAQSAAGASLYGKACAGCHGSDGQAKSPEATRVTPRPTNIADHRMDSMKDGEIFWVVTNGIGKAMPGFKAHLSETERWQIVAHVRRLRRP